MNIFTGLSAFPLTPFKADQLDEEAFTSLIQRLVEAGVDSITVLGSTGSYMYLNRSERARIAQLAVAHAKDVPVLVGVGAMRTAHVLEHIDDAKSAGAAGVLVAPVGYQKLGDDEVFTLFRDVTEHSDLPVVVYDNPGTTHFTFSNELYGRIARLPGIASIKIPGVPADPVSAKAHVQAIRQLIPAHVSIGVSGDASGVPGLIAGCDLWYSVLGGTLPQQLVAMTRAALAGEIEHALDLNDKFSPLWQLNAQFGGSLRVTAAIAEHLSLVPPDCLPLPIHGLDISQREQVVQVLQLLGAGK